MISPICEKAINEALQHGNALLKFISPNDAGVTGGHQSGFYLPKSVWKMYTPHEPIKGKNSKHEVIIGWHDGRSTESVVTWYGKTKSEYRLTKFGRDFPFLVSDTVGDLLVLIPISSFEFTAYILDRDEDMEEILAALGVQPFEQWAVYVNGAPQIEDKNECLEKQFQDFAKKFNAFPKGEIFSEETHKMLEHCFAGLSKKSFDERILEYYNTEYKLFQVLERQVCQPQIGRLFKDVDDFLRTAGSLMNRRKSRAGRSLENHVDYLLKQAEIPHEMRPKIDDDGVPDIIIPNHKAYLDSSYPIEKLFVIGVKTTCKDRWRQVLNEGKRVKNKHILTLQRGISSRQLTEMHKAGITLIVPKEIQKDYPKNHPITILTMEKFISSMGAVVF